MLKDDLIRIRHILDASQEALAFAKGKSREDFFTNRMLVLSIVKDIEIIGEAANKISKSTQSLYPQIPWQDMINMRNHLIHEYFDIDVNVVWQTITMDLPPLIDPLKKIVTT